MDRSDPAVQKMKSAAEATAEHAYVPYSRFLVGAAVLTEDGTIFSGCNVENASYGLSVCAERNAIFQAIAGGQRKIRAVVIFVPSGEPAPPCGACRQVIAEFSADAEVFCFSGDGGYLRTTVGELLPHPFRMEA